MWILLLDTSKKMPRRRRGHGWTRRRPLQLLLPPPPTQPRHKCEPLPAYHITTTVALFAAAVDFIGTTSLKLPPHSSLQINEDHLCPLSRRSRQMSTTGGWQFMSSVYEVLFSLFLSSLVAPPLLSTPITHPPSMTPTIPTWTHTFNADSNSSNRVRAAAIAFLAQERGSSYYSNLRLLDKNKKKKSKQEKFLIIAAPIIDIHCRLTTSDIKQDLIVFDGTESHPPPPISPPPK